MMSSASPAISSAGNAMKAIPAAAMSLFFQKNPFMLYSGQEFGEKGMDKEGFSGRDGRTTIFDYWSPETLAHAYQDSSMALSQGRNIWLPPIVNFFVFQ